MSVELNEVQNGLINKIAKENGFNNYEVTTNKGSEKGDNFMGILTTVTLDNGENKLELILKTAHQQKMFRKEAPIRRAYLREIYMYENIFNEFKNYQEDHNVADPFDSYVKVYGSSTVEENECFVMENLKIKGYQLWNRKTPMNSEHISAVLTEYAKLHATSLAMKHKNPELFEKLTKDMKQNIWEEGMEEDKFLPYIKSMMELGYKCVEDNTDLTEFLKKVEAGLPELFFKELKKPEYEQVLIHGDCWCNNIMFKYDNEVDKKKPSRLKIVDWQIAYVNSPAYDFCYFFLMHSPKEILDDYESYLKLYYESFSQHLKSLKCDPDKVFSYSRFEEHINRYMVYGLYLSFIILRIMLSDSAEAPDFSETSEKQNFFESLDFKIKNFDALKERIITLIVFIKEHNFFKN